MAGAAKAEEGEGAAGAAGAAGVATARDCSLHRNGAGGGLYKASGKQGRSGARGEPGRARPRQLTTTGEGASFTVEVRGAWRGRARRWSGIHARNSAATCRATAGPPAACAATFKIHSTASGRRRYSRLFAGKCDDIRRRAANSSLVPSASAPGRTGLRARGARRIGSHSHPMRACAADGLPSRSQAFSLAAS